MRCGLIVFLVAASIGLCAGNSKAGELKIGHVDLQRLVAQSEAGKAVSKLYAEKQKKYQDDIDARTEKLKILKSELEKEGKLLKTGEQPSIELLRKNQEYGFQSRELQQLSGVYQNELKISDTEMINEVMIRLAPILQAYVQKHGFDYIIRGGEVLLYASSTRDITDDLLKEFNNSIK